MGTTTRASPVFFLGGRRRKAARGGDSSRARRREGGGADASTHLRAEAVRASILFRRPFRVRHVSQSSVSRPGPPSPQ